MKRITKQNPPNSFLSWRDRGDPDWHPSYSDLAGQPKIDLHDALLQEQGYICCYCGMGIARDNSHYNGPRNLDSVLSYTWEQK